MRARRGQSLVLWAFALLVLSLMVFINLSLGQRIRDRMELQELADAAAYDEAVLTARYFNATAVLNRAKAADGVVLAGHQAIVSYLSALRSTLLNVDDGLTRIRASFVACCNDRFCAQRACACREAGELAAARTAIADFRATAFDSGLWEADDRAAAAEFSAVHGHSKALELTQDQLDDVFRGPSGLIASATRQVLAAAAPAQLSSGALRPGFEGPPASRGVTPHQRPFAVLQSLPNIYGGGDAYLMEPMVGAAMAARPEHFTVSRRGWEGNTQGFINLVLGASAPSVGWSALLTEGGSGFGESDETSVNFEARNRAGIAHDHVRARGWSWKAGAACAGRDQPTSTVPPSAGYARLVNSHLGGPIGGGEHFYERGYEPWASKLHDIGGAYGSSILRFAVELGVEPVAQEAMLFGQPLFTALVVRDPARAPPRPWDLSFRLRFTSGGQALDLAKQSGEEQLAMAGGLAYYHRAARLSRTAPAPPAPPPSGVIPYGELSSWKEPANLWNPFWRASLFVSGQGRRQFVLGGQVKTAQDDRGHWLREYGFHDPAVALEALTANGYRGAR